MRVSGLLVYTRSNGGRRPSTYRTQMRVASDVGQRDDLHPVDRRFLERAGDHLDPLARRERVLPGERLLRAADPDQERGLGSLAADRSHDREVAPVERLEPADEQSAHGTSISLGGQIFHVVQELVDVRATSGEVVPAVGAVLVVPRRAGGG